MLKRRIMKKILVSTAAIFALLLVYFIPSDEKIIEPSSFNLDMEKEAVFLLDSYNMLGMKMIPVSSTDIVGKARELIDTLIIDGKKNSLIPSGFKGTLPSDTFVNGIVYENNNLKVDFNADILDIASEYEMPMIESLVYTLTSLQDVESISILVNGNPLNRLPHSNTYIPDTINREFGINKRYDIDSLNNIVCVTEYFIGKYNNDTYYVPVTKYVNDNREKIKIIIEDLSNSHTYSTNLMSYINSNTKLLETNLTEDIIELTFNDYILSDFDSNSILEEVKESILLSIKDNYDIKEVVFNVFDNEICKSVIKTIE